MGRQGSAVALALAFVAVPAAVAVGAVPCAAAIVEPVGCPDLVVDADDLGESFLVERSFASTECAVEEGLVPPGPRALLLFTFTTPNVGLGDLVVGAPWEHPEWFEWAPCHAHYHFREYADYRLWTFDGYAAWTAARALAPGSTASEVLDARPDLRDSFVAGNKLGFCVADIEPVGVHVVPAKYGTCFGTQGISPGWADSYGWWLDGQWIDVTDVPDGDYVLEAEVNAERLFVEADYTNGAAAVYVPVYR